VLSKPDITADVNADGAIKCTNTALHTAGWFGNNMPAGKNFAPARSEWIFFVRHDFLTIRPSNDTRKLYQQQPGNLHIQDLHKVHLMCHGEAFFLPKQILHGTMRLLQPAQNNGFAMTQGRKARLQAHRDMSTRLKRRRIRLLFGHVDKPVFSKTHLFHSATEPGALFRSGARGGAIFHRGWTLF
jgi:hypothetical protein